MGNLKQFSNYQYIGGEMTKRDKQEVGSKFWNEGKWNNFVLPFLPKNCKGMTLIDMGCNAGIFLRLAEEKGFDQVVGVDSNKAAVKKAILYRRKNKGTYRIYYKHMEKVIDILPVADFTILANAHYYFPINNWLDYLDKLVTKTRYCIIVTAKKKEVTCKASANPDMVENYFRNWDKIGNTIEPPLGGDPYPRRLWGLCFKSPLIERVSMDSLYSSNKNQISFWPELDKGIEPLNTEYYKFLKKYRGKRKWPQERITKFMLDKAELFESIKKNGMRDAIIINRKNKVVDGSHRYEIKKYLGHKTILARRTS